MNNLLKINNLAIVLASGSGSRFNAEKKPKHLIKIKNIPTIVWTLDSLLKSNIFNEIVIVTRELDLKKTSNIISKYFDVKKLCIHYAVGGKNRMDSFLNGISKILKKTHLNDHDIISLIDSNRPFCSVKQIRDLNSLATKHGCSCPARPLVNGVAKIISNKIVEVPKKEDYVEFVTPEFLKYKIFKKSQKKNKKFKSLVEYSLDAFVNPIFVTSSELNSKLTYPEDLMFLEGLVAKHKLNKPLKIK